MEGDLSLSCCLRIFHTGEVSTSEKEKKCISRFLESAVIRVECLYCIVNLFLYIILVSFLMASLFILEFLLWVVFSLGFRPHWSLYMFAFWIPKSCHSQHYRFLFTERKPLLSKDIHQGLVQISTTSIV